MDKQEFNCESCGKLVGANKLYNGAHMCQECVSSKCDESDTPLKDSGARRVFGTGAVRDISEGKGRCDLLPLDAVGLVIDQDQTRFILQYVEKFKASKQIYYLVQALWTFAELEESDIYTLMLEVSKHYEDGAKKYAPNNWMLGIDLHCYIDSGVRHFLKHRRGDTDEPHDRAFVWNMIGAIWTYTHKPELDDISLPVHPDQLKANDAEATPNADEYDARKLVTQQSDVFMKVNRSVNQSFSDSKRATDSHP